MAAKFTDFSTELLITVNSLKRDLLEGIHLLKQRREVVEKQCERCQNLFKPWPQNLSQTCEVDAEKFREHEQETAKEPNSKDEKEKQELAMLDDILAKAQQARDVHTKFSKSSKRGSKSTAFSGSQISQKVHSSATKEAKVKPKIAYPTVSKPSAKSTYVASYKTSKTRQLGSGNKQTSGSTSQLYLSSKLPQKEKIMVKNKSQSLPETSTQNSALGKVLENAEKIPDEEVCVHSKISHSKDCVNTSSEQKFILSKKGSLLTMSADFVKLSKIHRKLLNRICKINAHSSLGDSRLHFAKRVEELFCPAISRSSGKAVKERLADVVKEYEELLDLTRFTMFSLQSVVESTCFETMSNGCSTWEFITSKYEKLNEEIYSLTKAMDCMCCPCPKSINVSVNSCNSHDAKSHDEKSHLSSSLASIATKSAVWFPSNNDGFFTYANLKELKTLQKLSHDYETMKYEIELSKIIGEKILPLLREFPNNHRLFIPLFRSVYSTLCCNGRTFPTLIKDVMPDNEVV